jgi:hypothetical protein
MTGHSAEVTTLTDRVSVLSFRPSPPKSPRNCANSCRQTRNGLLRPVAADCVVLPVRIELTTSALPRMRSTTELRQHGPRAKGA